MIDAETRAVIERLIAVAGFLLDIVEKVADGQVAFPPSIADPRDAIAEARNLLDAQPAGKDAWLDIALDKLDTYTQACQQSGTLMFAAKRELMAHLRSHPAAAQLEAARKDVEKLRALYRAMREPMAMIGMDKHIGPFSDEAIALLDAMNALDGGTYSKSEGS